MIYTKTYRIRIDCCKIGPDRDWETNELAVYSKDTGTQPDLFYRPESNGTAVRLTGGGLTAASWCQFNGSTATLNASYNVASVVRNSTGNYTINFTRNFANTSYSIQIFPSINAAGTSVQINTRAVGSVIFTVRNNLGVVDSNDISVVIFGTLA